MQRAVADLLEIMERENNTGTKSLANETVQHLHRDYPDVVNYTACFLTHSQDQATCMECNPYPILL